MLILQSIISKRKEMVLSKRNNRFLLFTIVGIVCVLISQGIWLHNAYLYTGRQLMIDAKEAFALAYQKEQTYRVPFANIVNSGAVTIESCSSEEVQIIRYCPEPDTTVYNNLSGLSIESFINHVFVDLREQISPINIYCLSDLFSGMLFEKNIPVSFVVERFNTSTEKIIDSSLLPDKTQPKANPETTVVMEISNNESLRAILEVTSGVIFRQMTGSIICSLFLSIFIIACLWLLYTQQNKAFEVHASPSSAGNSNSLHEKNMNHSIAIGQYIFNPEKNELNGYGSHIQLNKKENSILQRLCMQYGNVVERNLLLEENWGGNGIIYSRSLDTYITTLRKYLKNEPSVQIVAVKGVGYKLVELEKA